MSWWQEASYGCKSPIVGGHWVQWGRWGSHACRTSACAGVLAANAFCRSSSRGRVSICKILAAPAEAAVPAPVVRVQSCGMGWICGGWCGVAVCHARQLMLSVVLSTAVHSTRKVTVWLEWQPQITVCAQCSTFRYIAKIAGTLVMCCQPSSTTVAAACVMLNGCATPAVFLIAMVVPLCHLEQCGTHSSMTSTMSYVMLASCVRYGFALASI